jgi:hypothetical protein
LEGQNFEFLGQWKFGSYVYYIISGSDPTAIGAWFDTASAAFMQGNAPEARTAMANALVWVRPERDVAQSRTILVDFSKMAFGMYNHINAKRRNAHGTEQKREVQELMEGLASDSLLFAAAPAEETRGFVRKAPMCLLLVFIWLTDGC